MRTLLCVLPLVLLSARDEDPRYQIPYGKLTARHRAKIRRIMGGLTATVPLPSVPVESGREVYDFLLEELPFTAAVCRVLGKAQYHVFRDPRRPKDEKGMEKWKGTYYLDDKDGLRLRVERALAEKDRRIFYTYGSFDLSPLPKIWGRSAIVVVWDEKERALRTEAKVYLQVTSSFYRALAGLLQGTVRSTVREKSTIFIKAARWVAEYARRDPKKLYEQIRGAREIDPEVLEAFRVRFLNR